MTIDISALDILRCPVSGQRMICSEASDDLITTIDGRYSYRVIDGIFMMLPDSATKDWAEEKSIVKSFYDSFGWEKSDSGEYNDTKLFVNTNYVPRQYTRKCLLAVNKFLPEQGKYLLDAGSGPIPHAEYMTYHENFERRVCVDFSFSALLQAKLKLGTRGIYIVGDVTSLPIADGAMQGAVCCHVLYHIPADDQHQALKEIARVIAPGGRGAIVYRWADSPLSWRMEKFFSLLSSFIGLPDAVVSKMNAPPLYFHAHPREWLLGQLWPFQYRLACFRIVDNFCMTKYITGGRVWKIITAILFAWQQLMPEFTGKYGLYPIIIIEK